MNTWLLAWLIANAAGAAAEAGEPLPVCPRWSDVGSPSVAGTQELIAAAAPVWAAPLTLVAWQDLEQVEHTASSVQGFRGRPYAPAQAFDGKLKTAWVEGAEGPGEGEWLEISFNTPPQVTAHGVMVVPGFARNSTMYRNNPRPQELTLSLSCPPPARSAQCVLQTADQRGPQLFRLLEPLAMAGACRLRITLGRSQAGERFADGSITEVWLVLAR